MNRDDVLMAQANAMTEKQLQANVMDALHKFGWITYHTYDSRKSTAGFPDIIAIRRERGMAIELKRQNHKTSSKRMTEQLAWLAAFDLAGFESAMWKPLHWFSGEIQGTLR